MHKLTVSLLALSLTACVKGYNPSFYYNELQVANLSEGKISSLRLRVDGSEKGLSCDEVVKNALCIERFSKRRYPQQGIQLDWVHPDGSGQSQTLAPPVPVTAVAGLSLQVILEIRSDASVKAFYKQEEPGRIFDDL
jgi:hypothetical protein